MASAPFYIFSVFTTNPFGGNPAVVVLLPTDSNTLSKSPSTESLQKIAKNFGQPITVFVSPISSSEADFSIRWFMPESELPICGHGTIAAAKAIFDSPNNIWPMDDNGKIPQEKGEEGLLRFRTIVGKVVTARKIVERGNDGKDVDRIQIAFPHTLVIPILPGTPEADNLQIVLSRALRSETVSARFMGRGGEGYEHYLMVELDESENLEGREVDCEALKQTGYQINILTTASKEKDVAFISRMFAPAAGVPEDPVCGSAHCLMTPYWSQKHAKMVSSSRTLDSSREQHDVDKGLDREMKVRQVSARGGHLTVQWNRRDALVHISGSLVRWGQGEVFI